MRLLAPPFFRPFLCSAILLAVSPSHVADRFVSPAGNDSHYGLSAATALPTLAAAAKTAPAGPHAIHLAGWEYPETESSLLAPGVSLAGAGIGQTIIRWSARQEPRDSKASP